MVWETLSVATCDANQVRDVSSDCASWGDNVGEWWLVLSMEPGAVTLLVVGCNKGDVGCREAVRDAVGDKVGEVLDPLAFLAKFNTL